MQIMIYIFWILIGNFIAFIFFKSQQWSVSMINPDFPKLSKSLIVGGAILRWVIITVTLILALRFSLTAMLVTFFTFIVVRVFMLLRWQNLINTKKKQVV